METFIKDMVSEHFQCLTLDKGVHRSDLPQKLQVTALWRSVEAALAGPPFIQTERRDRIPDLLRSARIVVADDLDPTTLPKMAYNPKARVVSDLLSSVGITNVWQAVQPALEADYRPVADLPGQLDAIVNHRHLAAHSPRVLSIARRDLRDAPRLLRALAHSLDDHVSSYCQTTAASALAAANTRAGQTNRT